MPDLTALSVVLASLLKIDGVAVIEVPYVKEMIDGCEFDTIYHEHLSYFSLTALDKLFRRHLLSIFELNGCRFTEGRCVFMLHAARIRMKLFFEEKNGGVRQGLRGFRYKVERLRSELVELLKTESCW